MRFLSSFTMRLLLVLTGALVLPASAHAQYFGRNKVQYEHLHFEVLHTPLFDIYYYPREEEAVRIAARLAERWYERHSAMLHHTLKGRQPIILYASHPQFEQTNAIAGDLGQGVGGVTEPGKRRIVLPFAGPLRETDHVIGHELVHAFQYDITKHSESRSDFAGIGLDQLPLWFVEGMAEYLSLGPDDANTAMWMREATRTTIPSYKDLKNPEYFPYRYGEALLAYIGSRWGNETIGRLLKYVGRKGDIDVAIDSVLRIKPDSLVKAWHVELHRQYDALRSLTAQPQELGKALITGSKREGNYNISPVLSPDGKQLVFFSERDLFAIDLFLADARTGKVKKNIFKMELDPHFQSLEFINSAGSWDPDGKRFVVSAVSDGNPSLAIIDVQRGTVEKEIPFPDLGEIFDPAWSPDGHSILFSALSGGLSDLFIYDLTTGQERQLTNDAYADLQPAWSPDGRSIAFVTDRFTTRLSDLAIGQYQLAQMDPGTGKITRLPAIPHAKNINPQWSPDGKLLYFLSDRDGITNIYKMDIAAGTVTQLTNLFSGVSGITDISPALSVARQGNRMVCSIYENGKYNIYAIDSSVISSRRGLPQTIFAASPAELAPQQIGDSLLAHLDNPDEGLVPDSSLHTIPYHAGLSIDGVGTADVSTASNQFGTYLGGGATLFWSDMLGNQNLVTALNIESVGSWIDAGGLVGYLNTSNRWNWGAIVQQTPYYITNFAAGYNYVNGEPAYIEQDLLYRELDREVSGILSYPYSSVFRTEFSAGFRSLSFRSELDTRATSLVTGAALLNDKQNLPVPASLNLGTFGTALVYDDSYFGATSPILGSRFRLDVSPTVGSLSWIDALADFRQYFMPVRPFTIALRALHYGRYGGGSEDYRLSPLYLGYPGLVRGYSLNSLSGSDSSSQVVLNQIQGSKIFVGNVELRFPLLGVFGLGKGFYGYAPIEFAAFYDAGFAWHNGENPWIFGGSQKPVSSVGAALRVNLMGIVGEIDYDRPLNRPGVGWGFEFNLVQGF